MSNSTIAIVLLSSHVSSNAIALRPKPEPHNQGPTCPTRPQQRMSWCDMTAVGGRQPGPSRVSTAGSRRHSCKRDYALAQTKARGHQVTLATVATQRRKPSRSARFKGKHRSFSSKVGAEISWFVRDFEEVLQAAVNLSSYSVKSPDKA
jgi:hypothetical protein